MASNALDMANRSFRRGGRASVVVIGVVGLAALALLATQGFTTFTLAEMASRLAGGWLVVALIVVAVLWLGRDARNSSLTRLTPTSLERGTGTALVHWADVTAAHYMRGWLQLEERSGRKVRVSLLFASSGHDVVEAVQDCLPAGVRLSVY